MRISDWSSYVCSSDLSTRRRRCWKNSAWRRSAEPRRWNENGGPRAAVFMEVLPHAQGRLHISWPLVTGCLVRVDQKKLVERKSGSERVVVGGHREIKQKRFTQTNKAV